MLQGGRLIFTNLAIQKEKNSGKQTLEDTRTVKSGRFNSIDVSLRRVENNEKNN